MSTLIGRGLYLAGALNFKMTASRLVNVTQEVINAIGKNTTRKSTKDATKIGVTIFKRKIRSFC